MSKQIAIMKLLPSLEIAGCINELLRELQSRGDYILDYENCDMSLDHIECHETDTLYCFFLKERRKDNEIVRN